MFAYKVISKMGHTVKCVSGYTGKSLLHQEVQGQKTCTFLTVVLKRRLSSETSTNSTENDTVKEDITEVASEDQSFPWSHVILDSPLVPEEGSSVIEREKHQMFKDLVDDLSLRNLPAVTTILDKTKTDEDRKILEMWKKKMIREMGNENFQKMQQETLRKGSTLHSCIHKRIEGNKDLEPPVEIEKYWKSLSRVGVLDQVSDVVCLEKMVDNTDVMYRGKVDCVAVFDDRLCVIDWKTSSKPKPLLSGTYDSPVQIAAYIGAVNRSHLLDDSNKPYIKEGALIYAYEDGAPAQVHLIDEFKCRKYWLLWLRRLHQYWTSLLKT